MTFPTSEIAGLSIGQGGCWFRSVDGAAVSASPASLMMVRGQGWFSSKPKQGETTLEAKWQCLPFDILQQVGAVLLYFHLLACQLHKDFQ